MRRGQAVALYPETRGILLEEDHSSYLLVCKLKIMNSSHLKQKKKDQKERNHVALESLLHVTGRDRASLFLLVPCLTLPQFPVLSIFLCCQR